MLNVDGVPFTFFVSLLREISLLKPKPASHSRQSSSTEYPALRVFKFWIAELHRRFNPLPPDTAPIIFRLLFSDDDVGRRYDMQESRLAAMLEECLGVTNGRLSSWAAEGSSGCLGIELACILEKSSPSLGCHIASLSITQVDILLDELAALSRFSSSSARSKLPGVTRRSRLAVLRDLYRPLSATDAAFLTQIILKDLHPILYPISEAHDTVALKRFNTKAVRMLTREDAMKVWDPSGTMLKVYRLRSDLSEAVVCGTSDARDQLAPRVGTFIEIPKSEKGRSCEHAIKLLKHSKRVWAETKYDGERAQIHISILPDGTSDIKIFSKSKRDSTMDRIALHGIIRQSLGLCSKDPGSGTCKIRYNVVLDAEMVAFHEGRVDEFWRIRSLIGNTADGARRARNAKVANEVASGGNKWSQSSLVSDVSEDRLLGLVYFDILMLNSASLLDKTYAERRTVLERILQPIERHAFVAERHAVEMNDSAVDPVKQLQQIFSQNISCHEEGLVLKAEESRYNDRRLRWVKLKRDYIPGLGDCLDMVILGAGWDKKRARELRVAPGTLTTFYIGALSNCEEMKTNPMALPYFYIYFTASYGLSREQLEEWNFLIKASDPLPYNKDHPPIPPSYTYTMFSGLPLPRVLLRNPMLAELFGAGFTKAPGSRNYELRFPRITKIHRTKERSWVDGVSLQDIHNIACEVIGKDREDKDVDDWCRSLWGKPISPGINSSSKRKAVAEEWEERLAVVDKRSGKRKKGQMAQESETTLPLATTTNLVVHASQPTSQGISLEDLQDVIHSLQAGDVPSPRREQGVQGYPNPITSPVRPTKEHDVHDHSQLSAKQLTTDACCSSSRTEGKDSVSSFFTRSVVWWVRWKPCSPELSRTKKRLRGSRVHSIDSLLLGCGWHRTIDTHDEACQWAEHGVIIVEDDDWLGYVVKIIQERRKMLKEGSESRKPIWIFDSSMLPTNVEDVERMALCRIS